MFNIAIDIAIGVAAGRLAGAEANVHRSIRTCVRKGVPARAAGEQVGPCPAIQCVVSLAAVQGVVPRAS